MATESENLPKMLKMLEEHHRQGIAMGDRVAAALQQSATLDSLKAHVALDRSLEKFRELVDGALLPAIQAFRETVGDAHSQHEDQGGGAEASDSGGRRRQIRRFNKRLPVRFMRKGEKSTHRAYSRDVGASGLFILANRVEKAGQQLQVEVALPGVGPVQVEGEVVWTKWSPPSLRAIEYQGFGVKVVNAPEPWYVYFMKCEEQSA